MPATVPAGPPQGRLSQTVRFHRDPLGTLTRARDELGPVFTLRMVTTGPLVAVATPEGVRRIPESDAGPGQGGEARRQVLGLLSPHSILGADGVVHRQARGRVSAAFTEEAIARHREAIADLADAHARSWPRGRPTRLLPRLRALTDDIFVRCLIGVRDTERAAALSAAVRRMIFTPGNPPLPPPGDGAGLSGALGRRVFDRRKEPAATLVAAEVEARRAAGDDGALDVLGCILREAPERTTGEIVDEVLPLLMAGQEPPAVGLAWLLDRIGRTPGAVERFVADAAWRDVFVKETFRLRPPVHSVVRRLREPLTVEGVTLPPHAVALVPIPLVHRDPQAFPDPDTFRPERFLDGGADERMLLPFGGGPRRCLGEHLAHLQIDAGVPAILGAVHVRPLWPRQEKLVVRGTVTVPHRSLPVLVTAR